MRFTPVALLVVASAMGCNCGAASGPPTERESLPATPPTSELSVAVEGTCSKLSLATLEGRVIVIHGHRDVLRAAETFSEIVGRESRSPLDLLRGLSLDATGYMPDEIRLDGQWPGNVWLRRLPAVARPYGDGVVSLRHGGAGWLPDDNAESLEAAGESACAAHGPHGPAVVPRYCWRELDRRSLSPTETFAVGQCNICGRKAPLFPPVLFGGIRSHGSWLLAALPDASRLRTVDSASLAVRSSQEAYVAVAGGPDDALAYFARFDGHSWSALEGPFRGDATSIDGQERERLWATSGGVLWFKAPGSAWSQVSLAGIVLTDAPAEPLHAYGVQVRAPGDVWVEAAPSKDSPYRALLRTAHPERVFRCQEALPGGRAFAPLP